MNTIVKFSDRVSSLTQKIFMSVSYTRRLMWRKRTPILGSFLLLAQLASPLSVIVAYAAPTTSNQVGSSAALDPVGNKATRLQTQGSSGVDQSSGALTYSYPLTIPDGRNGMSPKLALSYNSQNNDTGWFGYGWNISIPYIERTTKNGTDKMYTSPVFVSSLHGELISTNGSSYVQKIDDGSYAQYTFSGNTWQMTDRDGTTYYFGTLDSSRISDASSTKIGRWYINEVRDKFGNGIIYNYTKDSGTVYPSTISYTEHALAHPLNLVTFNLESKNDKTISYKYGFRTVDTKRVSYIKTATNGKDNTYFTFNYTTGSNGVRSLLQYVEERHLGTNDDWVTLPKTSFEYENSPVAFSGSISSSINPYGTNVVIDTNNDGIQDLYNAGDGYFAVDINGDYKKDLMQSDVNYGVYSGGPTINLKYNQGGTFYNRNFSNISTNNSYVRYMISGMVTPPLRYMADSQWWWNQESAVVDMNGDGFDDIVYNDLYGISGVAVNTTNNTFDYSTQNNLSGLVFSAVNNQIADINGDGLQDVISKSYTATSTLFNVYLSNGLVYSTLPDFTYDAKVASTSADIGVRFADVNNDGLVDVIRSYTSNYQAGSRSACPTGFSGVPSPAPTNQSVNEVYINTGTSFVSSSSTLPGYLVSLTSCGDILTSGYLVTSSSKEYDNNGDLTTDYDGATNNTVKQDVLKKVTSPLGSTLDVSYTWTTKTGLNPTLPVPMYIVATTTDKLSASDQNPHAVGYSFYGGQMYFDANAPRDHKFAGFSKVDVVDGKNKTTTYYHQGNGDDYTTGEKGDSYYNIGRPYRTDTFDLSTGSSTIVSKNLSLYTTYSYASASFTYLDSQVSNNFNSDGSFLSSGSKNVYDPAKRLIKTSYSYGDIEPFTSFASSTITDKGTDILTTQYEYSNSRPQRLVKQVTTDYAGNNVSNVSYYYDNLPLGLVDKGAVTSVFNTVYKDDGTVSATSTTQSVYDPTGNVIQTIDNLNHKTTVAYDSSYFFPVAKVDALNGTTTFTYDPHTLNVLTTKGPDGITYVKETDGLGKVTRSYTLTSVGGITDDTRTAYVYGGGVSIYSKKIGDSGTSARSLQIYDSYGRLIQSKNETTPDVFSTQDTSYDSSSNVISTSLSYTTTGYGLTTDTPSNGSTVYTYDGLGRVITKSSFGTTLSYQYGARSLTVQDNASTQHKKSYAYDANGNLSQVNEYNGGTTYTTNYNYTPFNKLSRITDANGNIRNFSYLSNGSLVYQEDPHVSSDTTFTTYSYAYDSLGNLITKAGQLGTTTYTYDALNRPTSRTLSDVNYGTSTVGITYTGCSNNYSSPCIINRDTFSTTLSYNVSGKLSSESLAIDGNTFTRSYAYDTFGNPVTITYPDNGKTVYTYTLDGKQSTLSYITPSGATKNIVTNSTYNSLGALSSLSFGNGVQMCNTYTSTSADGTISPKLAKSAYLFNSTGCSVVSNQIELYKDEFTYKDNITPSAILSTYKDIAGTTHTKSDTYTYDNLARLTQVSTSYDGGSATNDALTYDPIGNILKENDVLYRYSQDGTQNVHAVTSVGGTHIAYDAQGNRVQVGDSSYAWNALNQMVSATTTNGTEIYTYDENGERIKKVIQTTSPINQKVTPSTSSSTLSGFRSGDLLAQVATSSTYIATSTYNTLSSLSLLSTSTLTTLVSNYYSSPFTSKFCATATSTSNRQNCIVTTTQQLLANNINSRGTSTVATTGLVNDVINIVTGAYLIPTTYTGLATSSIATSATTTFSINNGTISSYNTHVATGIVVPMAEYANLPYVSSSTYATFSQIGLTDTSKVRALLTLAGCNSVTSACTTAEKVVFERTYKNGGYLLSDKALQEMWYVFAAKARLPGNGGEFTATSTTLGTITVPTITGLSTSSATSTYYSGLYFTTEYTNQNASEPRLQFFNTIPYYVTQSAFQELQQAGITQTTLENYQAIIGDLFGVKTASSTEYMAALTSFIQYDKKATLSYNAIKELYFVVLGAATIPNNPSDYTATSIFDLTSYLTVNSYQYNGYTGTWPFYASGCYAGYYSGSGSTPWTRCVITTSAFSLPTATSSTVSYILTVSKTPQPTEWPLVVGNSASISGGINQTYTSTVSSDGSHLDADVSPTIVARLAGSTSTVMVANSHEFVTGTVYPYQAESVVLKAYVNTPRLTLADTSLVASISNYGTSTAATIATSTVLTYYKLDELSGNSADASGHNNTGVQSNISYGTGNGKINNGALFNGSNSKIVTSTVPATGTNLTATYNVWFKTTSSARQELLNFGDNNTTRDGLQLFIYTDGKLYINFSAQGGPNTTQTVTDGLWHMATVSLSSGTGSFYLDGSLVGTIGSGNLSITSNGSNSRDIGNYQSAYYWFNGSMDEFGVWSTALTQTDISTLYNGGAGLQYPFTGTSTNEIIATSTYTAGIQSAIGAYFGEIYDSSSNIITASTTASSSLVFVSQESYNEFASTTLRDAYSISKVFLSTTTPQCVADASTTECDKQVRETTFRQIVGNLSGFIPSQAAVEEFWMVNKGLLLLPSATSSNISLLYGTSTHVIFVNEATTTVSVLSRSQLPSTLATSTATTTVNLSLVPSGLLSDLQFNTLYSTSTFALATSTRIVSEDTYNELLHTPIRINSDVDTIFNYALPSATSSCSGQSATSSCVVTAMKTTVKNTISNLSGFILSDAALEELYRAYSNQLSIIPISLVNSIASTTVQTITLPLTTGEAFTTFSTTTVGTSTVVTSNNGACAFGISGATTSSCYIDLPYINSSVTGLTFSYDVSTSSVATSTVRSYLSYITQDASSTGSTSTPTFTTTIATTTIIGQKISGTKFTFDLTSLYQSYLNSNSPKLTLIPDANGTSSNVYSLSNPSFAITRSVIVPKISYLQFSSSVSTSTSTSTYTNVVSTSSLLSYYKLDGNSTDSFGSNSGSDASITYSSGNGKINNGAGFNGSSSNISTTAYTSLSTNFTWNYWINQTSGTGNQVHFMPGGSVTGALYSWRNGSSGHLYFTEQGVADYDCGTTLATGGWHMVTIVKSGDGSNNVKCYIDGSQTASTLNVGTIASPTGTAHIGNWNNSGNWTGGAIDELSVWGRDLSSTEVYQLYNANTGIQYPFQIVTTTTSSSSQLVYGLNSAQPIPFDRSTIPTFSTSTATTTIDLTSVPNLDFSTMFLSPVSKIVSNGTGYVTNNIIATTNIVAYYKLDGNSSDSFSSNGGSDTSITYSSGNGKINNGAGFNGSSSNISTPAFSSLGTNFTWNYWINQTSGTGNQVHFMSGGSATGALYSWRNSSGNLFFTEQGVADYDCGTALPISGWHMVTIVKNGDGSNNVKCYIDTTQTASTLNVGTIATPSGTAHIGNWNNSGNWTNGAIDEASVWSRAITTTDITNLYNSGTGLQYPFQTTVATTTNATTTIYAGGGIDTTYIPLPVISQQVLSPVNSFPFNSNPSTSTLYTSTNLSATTTDTIYYPFQGFTSASSSVSVYLTLNGVLVGTYTYQKGNEAASGKVTYVLSDFKNTPVLETDDKGDIVEADMTDVFGNYVYRDQRVDNALHTKGYTGHEYDDVTQNIYAHSRFLNSSMHSFLSVDPLLYSLPQQYLLDPQQMNSYVYVRNNPAIYTDPTGKCIEDACIGESILGISYLAMAYAPQIMSFAQSLSTPLGQMGIDFARSNYQQGNYKMAAFGAVTAGELGGLSRTGSTVSEVKSSGILTGASALISKNFSNGQAFENKVLQTIGEIKNTTKINTGSGDRIPDILNVTKGTIGEIKNTNNLYLTPQMKTFVTQAQKTNTTFTLYVNEVTKISKPLMQAINSVKGFIQRINK